jgi:hypothetical protein
MRMPKLCCVQLHPVFTNHDFFLDSIYTYTLQALLLKNHLIRSFSICNFQTPLSKIRKFLNKWLPELKILILKQIYVVMSDHKNSYYIGILKDFYTFGIAARQLLYLQWELCSQFDFFEITRHDSKIFTLSGCFPNLVMFQVSADISVSSIRGSVEVLFKTLTILRLLSFSRICKTMVHHIRTKFTDCAFGLWMPASVRSSVSISIMPFWVYSRLIKNKLDRQIQQIIHVNDIDNQGKGFVKACKWLQEL